MTDAIRVKLAADDILDMTLVAPEHGNALDAAMAEVMLKALRDLPDTAKAIVLTAEGADFCAGRRGGMPQGAGKLTAIDIRKKVMERCSTFTRRCAIRRFRSSPPYRAARRASAASLPGLANVAIAAEDAQFADPRNEPRHSANPGDDCARRARASRSPRPPRHHARRAKRARGAVARHC